MKTATIDRPSQAVSTIAPDQVPAAAPVSEANAMLAMIERVARDPDANVEKVERMMAMRKEILADEAKRAYDAALSAMQPELPIVARNGRIEIRAKDAKGERTGAIQQSTSYALWEDINEAIRPKLKEYGFALSFRTGLASDGRVTVTGILSHREGHREETMMTLQHDSTGSKNAVQAVGSSLSYGKRYTATALLNITTRGDDDDGKAAGAPPTITDDQTDALREMIEATASDQAKFLKFFQIEKLADLPADRHNEALTMLKAKVKS